MLLRSVFPSLLSLFLAVTACLADNPSEKNASDTEKFQILFNGNDLSGWKGVDGFWSVSQGAIVGQTTVDNPTKGNTFLVWQDGEVADFEFRCKVRFEGNNSGVQYRSDIVDSEGFVLAGYQADLHPSPNYFGMMYGEKFAGRGIIATRGQKIHIQADGEKKVLAKLPATEQLTDTQWNDLRIVAVGNRMIHQVNGVTTVDVTDDHPKAMRKGVLGLQLHAGPAMKVEFRNLLLRNLDAESGQQLVRKLSESAAAPSKEDAAADPQSPDAKKKWLTSAPEAQWIWNKQPTKNQKLFFQKSFSLAAAAKSARLYTTCDNHVKVWINGQLVGKSDAWQEPVEADVAKYLKVGENLIAIEGQNDEGTAALVLKMTAELANDTKTTIISDKSWKIADSVNEGWQTGAANAAAWTSGTLHVAGKLGVGPWNVPNYGNAAGGSNDPLNPRHIITQPGFVIERLYEVPKSEGSWVCLTTDANGGFFASDQGDKGLFHITFVDGKTNVEPIVVKDPENGQVLSGAQGLLWAFDSLWVHRNGGHLYRVTDSDQDGKLDTAERYPSRTGGGEHGNHALILTEDGKGIYMVGGNHAPMGDVASKRVQSWDEDFLLPRMWDARGHARGLLAPGGWVTRLDPETKEQELICIGFRNEYDVALNRFGDMFTFDADMEWDMGMPWYRPTRICQVVSGGDYGWRSGSGKWRPYFEDSLPPVVDIGPGSPTGVASGIGAAFPTKYQEALYALDWTFGTIYAIHMTPNGAGYTGESEPFVYGTPLPVTDAVVGSDGHFYFTVGGRGAASAFFRVRYVGDQSTAAPETNASDAAAKARQTRRMLEAFHGRVDAKAVETAWPYLASEDRFIRNAARVAIESQPVSQWADRALSESDLQSKITSAVALARLGDSSHQGPLLNSLLAMEPAELSEMQLLGLLRAYELAFIRLGKPSEEQRKQVIAELDGLLPNESSDVNRELVTILVYLRSPTVISKAMKLISEGSEPVIPDWEELASRNRGYGASIDKMRENPPPSQEIALAFELRNLATGWSLNQRRAYFEFLNRAAKGSGGASYPGFLENMRTEALQTCSNEEREALQDITGEDFNPVPDFEISPPKGPGKKWKLDEALAATGGKPDFERGRSLFFAAECGKCHRLAGLGGGVGPDLTSIPNKFDQRYVVEAIVHPSKDISDQYGSTNVLVDSGQVVTGIVVDKGDKIEVYPVKATDKPVVVSKDEIEAMEPSTVSQMPEGLLDALSKEEIRDLIAYLMAAGNPEDRRYQK